MRVIVDSRLRIPLAEIPTALADELRSTFSHPNPVFYKAKAMGFRSPEGPTIRTWKEWSGHLTLPRGGIDRLRELARASDIALRFDDRRVRGDEDWIDSIPSHKVALRAYQERATDAVVRGVNCICRAPTGSGKTTIAIAAIARIGLPALVIVWNGALAEQWRRRLSDELGIPLSDIGLVGGGKFELRPITVAMQQTLARSSSKLSDIAEKFGIVVCDELQRFAAKTFLDVIDRLPAHYRFGFSADESRKDGKEFLIHDEFGRVASDIRRKDLEDDGHVLPVLVRVVPTDFSAPWYDAQRDAFQTEVGRGRGKPPPDFTRLIEEMTSDVERNEVVRRVIGDEIRQGRQVIALTHRRDHATAMEADHGPGALFVGQHPRFEEFVSAFRSRSMFFGAGTYQAVGTGLDLPSVEVGVCTTPIHTNRQFFTQVRGRFCRTAPGKAQGILYYLWDRQVFGEAVLFNLRRWNDGRLEVYDRSKWVDSSRYLGAR